MAPVSSGGNIKVVVRVRPFNGRELSRKAQCVVQMQDAQTILTPAGSEIRSRSNKTFAFDKSYWSFNHEDAHYAGQHDVFTDLGRPLLDNAFLGFNNCIFAYGQTGSGKSYSMMGYGAEEGVIPKICRDLFERIEEAHKDGNLACTVEVSYLEIYNEHVRDLLNPSTRGNLRVREHPSTGPYVEDLAKLVVRSFAEIENLMDEGNKARTVAATNMNETSSRSHAVFTLTLTQRRHDVETNMDTEKVAKISLVDLAGSERANSTGATGARLKEGAEINRSLSTLGRVIAALADLSTGKKKSASMVPYRDSVLTWLLKDSLGGNSLTAMIATISPADINFEETLSTLRYADSAKRIKNHAVVNEDPNARMIRELKEELAQLRSKLTGGPAVGGHAEMQYTANTPLDQQFVSITQSDGSVKEVSKAEIAEQLSQSEKLYTDLNQTWEQKLQKTEEIHKEREAALEELGISIEKGFVGLSTPKKMPHLVNLSDDPLLAECLLYNLKPGTTTVGNADTTQIAEIRLHGSKILDNHCAFHNDGSVVSVVPSEGAAVMVNGLRIEQPTRVRSGHRIILGDFHIFRFNHPQEARAERAEQGSRLRHSMAVDDIGSPSLRPDHGRSRSVTSGVGSDLDGSPTRDCSPAPFRGFQNNSRDTDWDLARNEAIRGILGPDQKLANLADDELDVLFEDLQRVRARRGRPESRIFDMPGEDDYTSMTSSPSRAKHLSGGTLDTFSLDTTLTPPSIVNQSDEDDRLRPVRQDMQDQLEKQKEEFKVKIQSAEASNVEVEMIRAEKLQMEESLRSMKDDMMKQLQAQKDEHDRQLADLRNAADKPSRNRSGMTEKQTHLAKAVLVHWQNRRYALMAAAVLQNAATLKEAQVMSQQMQQSVVFQFGVVDLGYTFGSSYDMVLGGISTDDDPALEAARKPCIGVRVIDFKQNIVHLWSLQKLQARLRLMRQMFQYLDRPAYARHFRLDNPFSESCLPQYSRVGDADIPLTAVFECRVHDFTLDVYSPYTSTVVGIVHLSLEPSQAEAPSSTLKFNVVMHDLVGFPEREGTEVHAQLFFPGISEEDGATTTQMVSGFDEEPIHFDSVHSMGLALSAPRDSVLRVSIFAKVTSMHLDKLLSWDDMQDSASKPSHKRQRSRIPEHEYYNEEGHDILARVRILEIGETGAYEPVDIVQGDALDSGAYQLHQGLQRRMVVELLHASGEALSWQDVVSVRIGQLNMIDHSAKVVDLGKQEANLPLSFVAPPIIRRHSDGTVRIKFIVHWDSSTHGSQLLDRPTAEGYRIKLSLAWSMQSGKLAEPLEFSMDLAVQMRSRSYVRQVSLFSQLFGSERVVHSVSGIFALGLRPIPSKRVGDMWRLSTQDTYVKGEELLNGWAPRGVSLVRDFIGARTRRRRLADIERTKAALGAGTLEVLKSASDHDNGPDERQQALMQKVLGLWKTKRDISQTILSPSNTDSPSLGVAFASPPHSDDAEADSPPKGLIANVRFVPKNPSLLKAGDLLIPDASNTRWERRYMELRKPYLHMHSPAGGDEVNVINMTNSRVDHDPQVAKLLRRDRHGGQALHVFAVYAATKAWLFASKSEVEKDEWILAIDRSYFSSEEGSPADGYGYDDEEVDVDVDVEDYGT